METDALHSLGRDFFVLLLLPTLGVLGLMNRRALPLLRWTLAGWVAFGLLALLSGRTFGWGTDLFLRRWLLGVALGAAFLAVATLRNHRRVKPWLKVGLALLTLLAFARALLLFFERHA